MPSRRSRNQRRKEPAASQSDRLYVTQASPLRPIAPALTASGPPSVPLFTLLITFTVINKAVVKNDHALFNRLQHHISNGPGAPPPANGSYSPHNSTGVSPNMPNGRASITNGYQQSPYGAYQTPSQPARMYQHSGLVRAETDGMNRHAVLFQGESFF